eukprot:Seg597.11 transcript_id=Seg597.11/GoldUCD/mRNA.D3Y31 product="hypothetical protein" protein_id=Seg597.11/GoldUCD/D3Y31
MVEGGDGFVDMIFGEDFMAAVFGGGGLVDEIKHGDGILDMVVCGGIFRDVIIGVDGFVGMIVCGGGFVNVVITCGCVCIVVCLRGYPCC